MAEYVGRLYQWVGGDKVGQYEVVASEDAHEIKFDSGTTIAKADLRTFLVEQAIPGMDLRAAADPVAPGVLQPPPPPPPPQPPTEDMVIEGILVKQQNYDTVMVSVPMRLPSRRVNELLASMYDADTVGRIIGKRAIASLREGLESGDTLDSVAEFVRSYYDTKEDA